MRIHRLAVIGSVLAGALVCLWGCQEQSNPVLKQGYEALDGQQYEQASQSADMYLKENAAGAGRAAATYLRGRAIEQREKASDQEAQNDLREARAIYSQALGLGPERVLEGFILTSRANTWYWQNEFPAAEEDWRKAYDCLADDARVAALRSFVLYRIGVCEQRQGQFAQADQTFELVVQRFGGTDAAARALEHHGARQFYVQVGAFQTAAAAEPLVATLRGDGVPVAKVTRRDQNNMVLVMAGPVRDYSEAVAMRARMIARGHADAMIVP